MSITVDAIKQGAIAVMKARYGESVGAIYGVVMFGSHSFPGLIDEAVLVARHDAAAGIDFTEDMCWSLANDLAQDAIAKFLQVAAGSALKAAEITAEDAAFVSLLIVRGMFDPSTIGDDPRSYGLSGPTAAISELASAGASSSSSPP